MPPKILIVEDHADLRRLISLALADGGYQLFEAGNGPEALEVLERDRPDLVVLDVMLPGSLDGFKLCERIKHDPMMKFRTKVVFVTARGHAYDLHRGSQVQADAYLVKPFKPAELAAEVARLLAG